MSRRRAAAYSADMTAIDHAASAIDAFPGMLQIDFALQRLAAAASPFDTLAAWRLSLVALCGLLRALPNGSQALTKAVAPGIATYLSHDFPTLIAEEEEGILPRLRPRLLIGDNLDDIIAALSREHREDSQYAVELAGRCAAFACDKGDDWPELCTALAVFAERQRRHLAWEDATILPIARERLSNEDLLSWRSDMDRRYRNLTRSAPSA